MDKSSKSSIANFTKGAISRGVNKLFKGLARKVTRLQVQKRSRKIVRGHPDNYISALVTTEVRETLI